jgi:hypothetical protein
MIRYRVTAASPIPQDGLPEVLVTLVAEGEEQGLLQVEGEDPRFVAAVRARLRASYGVRGELLGDWMTRADLICAMQGEPMAALGPRRVA